MSQQLGIFLSLFVTLCAFHSVYSVGWKDCGSRDAKIKSIALSGWSGSGPCPLKKGTDVKVTVDFTTNKQVNNITAVVHGVIAGVPVPFPLNNPNACQGCNLDCPLKSSTSYTYKTAIPVKKIYPSMSLVVKWELKDKQNNDVICFVLPCKIEG